MKDILAATRYAQALFEIVHATHQDEQVEAELESFSAVLKNNPEIEKFLNNPKLRTEEKRKFLSKLYQDKKNDFNGTLLNFYTVLFEKNRFYLIHQISTDFKRIADESQGQGTAQIITAAPLSAQDEARIVSRLETIAGYKIEVKKEVNPALIGGVVMRLRNHVWDGSIKNKLSALKKELSRQN